MRIQAGWNFRKGQERSREELVFDVPDLLNTETFELKHGVRRASERRTFREEHANNGHGLVLPARPVLPPRLECQRRLS